MKKYTMIFFVINILATVIAFGLLGLFGVLALSLALYKFLSSKFEHKPAIAEKAMFLVGHVAAVFAIHDLIGVMGVTFMVALFEAAVFLIFGSFEA